MWSDMGFDVSFLRICFDQYRKPRVLGCYGIRSFSIMTMYTARKNTNARKPDILGNGFYSEVLHMRDDYDGPVIATLIQKPLPCSTRYAVLYIHGYADYFFKTELADSYIKNGYDFYALDLRKYGRSLLSHQLPNFCKDVGEYFEEIQYAIKIIRERDKHEWLVVHGHSTGALIVSLLARVNDDTDAINAIILDSPFFSFNEPCIVKQVFVPLIAIVAREFPYLRIPGGLSKTAGECIHESYHGEWSYRLDWKPIGGFPLRAGWIRAIHMAHLQIHSGVSLSTPILVMHAAESSKSKRCASQAMRTDTVLDVSDIIRYSKNLGNDVSEVSIPGAMHDLVLSAQDVRIRLYHEIFSWLTAITSQ